MVYLTQDQYISYDCSNYTVHWIRPYSLVEFMQEAVKLYPKGHFSIFRNRKYDITFYYADGKIDYLIQNYILKDELIHSVKAQGGSEEMVYYINITDNR